MNDKIRVTFREIIVDNVDQIGLLGFKPYYSIRYREVGEENYNIGYSSYSLGYVKLWWDKYFEDVEEESLLKRIFLMIKCRKMKIKDKRFEL